MPEGLVVKSLCLCVSVLCSEASRVHSAGEKSFTGTITVYDSHLIQRRRAGRERDCNGGVQHQCWEQVLVRYRSTVSFLSVAVHRFHSLTLSFTLTVLLTTSHCKNLRLPLYYVLREQTVGCLCLCMQCRCFLSARKLQLSFNCTGRLFANEANNKNFNDKLEYTQAYSSKLLPHIVNCEVIMLLRVLYVKQKSYRCGF